MIKLDGKIILNVTHAVKLDTIIEYITGGSGIKLSHSDLMEAWEERFNLMLEDCARDLVEVISANTDAESTSVDYDIE